ncbi:MAG TPA: hypothetical protein PK151_04465 [Caldisericia bacterium]|nr:hypothetical protein [Caldisericia bacterium]
MTKYVVQEGKMVKVDEMVLLKPNIKVTLNDNGSVKFDFSQIQELFTDLVKLFDNNKIKAKINYDDKEITFIK